MEGGQGNEFSGGGLTVTLKLMQKAARLTELQKSQQSEAHATDRFLLNGQKSQRRNSTKDKIAPLPIQYKLFLEVHETPATSHLLENVLVQLLPRMFFFPFPHFFFF